MVNDIANHDTKHYEKKRSLNGDGEQFHEYQQKEQSPLSSKHGT